MADISNLEKLGTELKCPICLSLLNCSVSLTCNHVFCNACIGKSMKSASGCPVCKLPFHRREIRPAPHMDSLVAIYKNMEVASGVKMFISQNGQLTQGPGNEDEFENDKRNTGPEMNLHSTTTLAPKVLRKCKRKGSNISSDEGKSNPSKPSFPTKKRVQVPPHPDPETPAPETPVLSTKSKQATCGASIMENDRKATIGENGEPVLSPFFWLREEEEAEKSSQQTQLTDGDQSMGTPQAAPNFSDIMESDDDLPSNETPNNRNCMTSNISDLYDSEMFEWTQRPSSPELCSPRVLQDEGTGEHNELKKNHEAVFVDLINTFEDKSQNKENEYQVIEEQRNSFPQSSPMNKTCVTKVGTNKLRKRAQKITRNVQKKRVKRSLIQASGTLLQPPNLTDGNMENLDTNIDASNLKNNNEIQQTSCASAKERQLRKGTAVGAVAGSTSRNEHNSSNVTTSFRHKEHEKDICSSKNSKEGNSINPMQWESLSTRKSKKPKHCSHGVTGSPNEGPISHQLQESKSLKTVKFAEGCASKSTAAKSSQNLCAAEEHKTLNSEINIEFTTRSNPEEPNMASNTILLNGETVFNDIKCAFCQSTEESEESGVMCHFFKGEPVDKNWNGGSGVMHAHKSCTEWAPNVYFQDDNVINLESELSRSRRIKCGFCGIKGAALGCYHKSCQRSFHVPCAKLTPQCRWDHENFVMLCPLHAKFKLPKEETKRVTKRCSPNEKSKSMNKEEPSVNIKWKTHDKSKDMVLCCSALTENEKGTVIEFEKLARVKIVKDWDSSITHVIASTDQNGACRRTLKFLMGVLEGKWIMSIEWVRACMDRKQLVDEKSYEVKIDIHGTVNGPRLGRMRLLQKQPKLFTGCDFYFLGNFANPYKQFLHGLIVAAGGTVLNRKPISKEQVKTLKGCAIPQTFIIYSSEPPEKCDSSKQHLILDHRKSNAEALAGCSGAVAVSNTWILNSIAGYKLECFPK